MRHIIDLSLIMALAACLAGAGTDRRLAVAAEKGPAAKKKSATAVALFNGKDLEGWSCFLVDPAAKMEDVWSVKDGILISKGQPLGYLLTNQEFTNFSLIVEWRWAPGTEPGNSGVLLRIAGDAVSFLPRCVEAQLKSGSAGDLWAFYGAGIDGHADRLKVVKAHEQLGDFRGVEKIEANEKAPGHWNKYVIKLSGDQITLSVNGKVVNKATGLDVTAGPIGLQSEGGEIHFRTVRLIPEQ